MSDKKTDKPSAHDLLNKAKNAPKKIAPKQVVVPEHKQPQIKDEQPKEQGNVTPKSSGKVGRPTEKDASIEYVKMSARIPLTTRKKMRMAIGAEIPEKVKTQDEFINKAILFYIDAARYSKDDE